MTAKASATRSLMGIAIARHVVSSAAGLSIIPIVAHLLGAPALAAWALLGTSAFVLGISDLGLSAAVQRAAARRQDELSRDLVATSLLCIAVVAIPLAIVCRTFFLDIPADAEAQRALDSAAWPTLGAGVLQAFGFPHRAWLMGRGALKDLTRARLLAVAVQVPVSALGVWLGGELAWVGVGLGLGAVVELVLNVRSARALDPLIPTGPARPARPEVTRQALRDGSAALVVSLAALAALRLDLALLARHAPVLAIAAYAVAARAVDQSFTVAKQVSSALLPKLAHDATRDEAITIGTRVLGGLVAVGMIALALLGRPLLGLWAGSVADAPEMIESLILLGAAAVVSASHETVASALTVGGKSSWDAARPLAFGYVVNFVISAALVGRYGVFAIASGTLVGAIITSFLLWARAGSRFGWHGPRIARLLLPVLLGAGVTALAALPLAPHVRGAVTGSIACALTMLAGMAVSHWSARRFG